MRPLCYIPRQSNHKDCANRSITEVHVVIAIKGVRHSPVWLLGDELRCSLSCSLLNLHFDRPAYNQLVPDAIATCHILCVLNL